MTNQDPRLLWSREQEKAADVEARLIAHVSNHPAAPPALVYTVNTTVVTQSVNGAYSWTCPAGVTQAKVECWGAGAGAGGGGPSRGGEGGGGGEYASEPAYAVVPGQAYSYLVGTGGTGGTTGNGGNAGGSSSFDNGGVFANGGAAGGNFTGGPGGSGSTNTAGNPGGSGGGTGSQGTGGCGGGGSGGSGGAGGAGATSASATGAAGGTAGASGGAAGGTGGNSAANGTAGASPGAGGGGCGASPGGTQGTLQYRLSASETFFGSDAVGGNANQQRFSGTMSQGGLTAEPYKGTMKALGIIGGSPQADLAGKTIDSVSIRLEIYYAYYNGAYLALGYTNRSAVPGSWDGTGITAVKNWFQGTGNPAYADLTGAGLGSALQSGAAQSVCLGPGSPANWAWNRCDVYGSGGDNAQNPLITVTWHTGTAPVQAGAGADGQVKITYTTPGPMTVALQPAAGTEPAGNAFAQGYTGPVTAFQPGASPSVAETWHAITTDAGWSSVAGYSIPQYRLTAQGDLQLAGNANAGSVLTANKTLNASNPLPAAYRPNNTRLFRSFSGPGGRGAVQIDATGVITMLANSTYQAQYCEIDAVLKLN